MSEQPKYEPNGQEGANWLTIEDHMGSLVGSAVETFISQLISDPRAKDMTSDQIADKIWEGLTELQFSKDSIKARINRLRK